MTEIFLGLQKTKSKPLVLWFFLLLRSFATQTKQQKESKHQSH